MPGELLNEALEEAQRSSPPVRAMALLHIARVLTALDRSDAKRTLEQALEEIDALPAADREPAMNDVVSLIATVSPEEALRRASSLPHEWRQSNWIFHSMMDHGHMKAVVDYLANPPAGVEYPSMAMLQALADCRQDPEAQRKILRGGMRAMGEAAQKSYAEIFRPTRSEFVRAFEYYWKVLPREEAKEFLGEYVTGILQQPDEPTRDRLSGPTGTVRFSSTRQRELFAVLGPLRQLDPARAESLIRDHDQLAKAASQFPDGFMEAHVTAEHAVPQVLPTDPIEWDEVTHQCIPASEWLSTTFNVLFDAALKLYTLDTAAANPNRAPREIWPSTQSFRALLYRAGKHEGLKAAGRLDRIPDPDLRLFAKVEVAAAVAGLPPIGGSQQAPRPPERPAEEAELTSLDLAALPMRWKGHGRARRVRTEVAGWDSGLQKWSPVRMTTTSLYGPDGLLIDTTEQHSRGPSSAVQCDYDSQGVLQTVRSGLNEDITTFECSYGELGQLVRIASRSAAKQQEPEDYLNLFSMSSSWSGGVSLEFVIGEDGLKITEAAAISIEYDRRGKPAQISFFDENDSPMGTSRRTWNDLGILVKEEFVTAQPVIPEVAEGDDENLAFEQSHWITTMVYDERGHCVQRTTSISGNTVSRVESQYDNRGNPIEQRMSEPGDSDNVRVLRYEYVYDALANWTERMTRRENGAGAGFEPLSIERRQIEYF